jgi:hypothetical protein
LLNQFEGQAKRNLEEEKFEIPWRQAVGKWLRIIWKKIMPELLFKGNFAAQARHAAKKRVKWCNVKP